MILRSQNFFKSFLARQYLRFIDNSKFVVVAGAVGKTTTVLAAKSILSQKFDVLVTTDVGQTNRSTNIFSTVLDNKPKHKKIILEIDNTTDLNKITPKTLIVTRTYSEDPNFLENSLWKIVEKTPSDGLAILNGDDIAQKKFLEKGEGEVIFYGTDPKSCHVWASNLKISNFNTIFELNYGVERVEITSKLLGFHQIYPLLAAAALAIAMDFSLINIKRGLESMDPLEHKFQAFSGANNSIVIDDTGNAHPLSIIEALEALNHISGKRRILVLSQPEYSVADSEKICQEIARKIYKDKIDHVFLMGEDAKIIADELSKLGFIDERLDINLNNSQAVNRLLNMVSRGDLVLIKGSSSSKLGEVVKRITKK